MELLATARKSMHLLNKNKIIYVPHLLIVAFNFLFLVLFLILTNIGDLIFKNSTAQRASYYFNLTNLIYFLAYLALVIIVDNFLTAAKYGMIKDVILKGKTTIEQGFYFAKKHFFTTLTIHAGVFLVFVLPALVLAFMIFYLLADSPALATGLFVFFLVVYLIYVSIRLLFVYPTMTFEDLGAYSSFKEDLHYVKSHVHHTYLTWLLVMGIAVTFSLIKKLAKAGAEHLSNKVYIFAIIVGLIILILEMFVSLWEHVFIFEEYLVGNNTKPIKKKSVRKKLVKIKKSVTKKKVSKKTAKKQIKRKTKSHKRKK